MQICRGIADILPGQCTVFHRWMKGKGSKGSKIYKHGQYKKAGTQGTNSLLSDDELVHIQKGYGAENDGAKDSDDTTIDDHHSPLRADSYVYSCLHHAFV